MGRGLRALLIAALLVAGSAATKAGQNVKVFAAASTTNAVAALAELYEGQQRGQLTLVFAASSTLARQIVSGAPADIYLSANRSWMDYVEERGAIEAASRRDLLSNRLILIAPPDSTLRADALSAGTLARDLGDRRLAIGDPDHVPAGVYAKAALKDLALWQSLAGRLVYAGNVRAALALADRGEVAAAVVYASDVGVASDLRQVAKFPATSHPAILYPLAIVAGRDKPEVRAAFEFLSSPEALAVFRAAGFVAPPR